MRLWMALILMLTACAAKHDQERIVYQMEDSAARGGGAGATAFQEGDSARRMAKVMAAPPAPPPPPPLESAEEYAGDEEAPSASGTPVSPAQRLVHYDGWVRMRVPNPRDALEAVVALAERAGGRTEQLSGNTVTVRVPVARFEAAWNEALGLGDVMDRSVRADDVTEQYTSVDLRVRTLRATRDRLVQLLAKSRDDEERLRLLAQLTRVTEQLDAMESQLRTLAELASMSRITVEAVPREAFTATGGRPVLDGMQWIGALSPFRRSTWDDDKRIPLATPEGMVMLSTKGPYSAESPDGTVLWTFRVRNDPVGTGTWWASSVADRVAAEFENAKAKSLGSWACLTLDQPTEEAPYRWQICVRPDGPHLDVAQAWFPSPAQVTRYEAAVDAALAATGGGV